MGCFGTETEIQSNSYGSCSMMIVLMNCINNFSQTQHINFKYSKLLMHIDVSKVRYCWNMAKSLLTNKEKIAETKLPPSCSYNSSLSSLCINRSYLLFTQEKIKNNKVRAKTNRKTRILLLYLLIFAEFWMITQQRHCLRLYFYNWSISFTSATTSDRYLAKNVVRSQAHPIHQAI